MNYRQFLSNLLILCALSASITADDSAYWQNYNQRNPMSAQSEAQQRQIYNQGNPNRQHNWGNGNYTNPDGGLIIQNYYDPDYPYYNYPAQSYAPATTYGYPTNNYYAPPNNGYYYPAAPAPARNYDPNANKPPLGVPLYGR